MVKSGLKVSFQPVGVKFARWAAFGWVLGD